MVSAGARSEGLGKPGVLEDLVGGHLRAQLLVDRNPHSCVGILPDFVVAATLSLELVAPP
jgi:hypothetical protein